MKEGIWGNGNFLDAGNTPLTKPKVIAKRQPKRTTSKSKKETKMYSTGSGTGFAITNLGHVITNYHVISECAQVKIHHKGKSAIATIISRDKVNDLALLRGKFKPEQIYRLSDKSPELTQDIYVAGYPFGRKISGSVKVQIFLTSLDQNAELIVASNLFQYPKSIQEINEYVLKLNGTLKLKGVSFGIRNKHLILSYVRPVEGLDREELEWIIACIAVIADEYDDFLIEKFDL